MPTWSLTRCAHCGAEMEQAATGRPRRFCSAACRTANYRARVTKVNRTAQAATSRMILSGGCGCACAGWRQAGQGGR